MVVRAAATRSNRACCRPFGIDIWLLTHEEQGYHGPTRVPSSWHWPRPTATLLCFRPPGKGSPRDIIGSGEFESDMARFAFCFSALFALIAISASSQTAPTASAPAASAVTSTAAPELAEFQKIEDNWSNAINTRDQYGMELVLSPLFVDVSADGSVSTRNQQLATLLAGDDKTLHLDQHVVAVRMLGDIAVANGTYVLRYKGAAGPVEEKG